MNLEKKNNPIDKMRAWEKFVEGDEDCFENVFRSFYKPMYGYGMKLGSRPALVADCIHELFEDIWRRRTELAHIHSPNVYLFVSLRRKILKNGIRRSTTRSLNEVDESGFTAFSQEELIIEDEIKVQQKQKLQNALNQLPDRQKEVIFLLFYNGMSYGEVEKILSIKRQSVRNHVYRAMQTLRSLLDTEIMKLVVSWFICFLLFV